MQRCPLDKPKTTNPKHIEEALDRMMDPTNMPTIGAKPSKLAKFHPKNWPPKVRLVVVAALAAGLGAAGVPQGIVALVTQLFGG
jgi:hypothetical protein